MIENNHAPTLDSEPKNKDCYRLGNSLYKNPKHTNLNYSAVAMISFLLYEPQALHTR